MSKNAFNIRPMHLADLTTCYRILVQVANDGDDASHLYRDHDLLGHTYAAPYFLLEPELCFVLSCSGDPCGFIVGTRDSAAFAKGCQREWFPLMRARYRLPAENDQSLDAGLVRNFYRESHIDPDLQDYPAHLHIDIGPAGQNQGQGARLMDAFIGQLRSFQVPGVHLGVSKTNGRAVRFYRRYGFKELKAFPFGFIMGLKL